MWLAKSKVRHLVLLWLLLVLFGVDLAQAEDFSSLSLEELKRQISYDVRGALRQHSQAPNYKAWRESGWTPADIFSNIDDLSKSLPGFQVWDLFCKELGNLTSDQLSLFSTVISSEAYKDKLPCSQSLSLKIETYWNEKAESMAEHFASLSHFPAKTENAADGVGLVFVGGPVPKITHHITRILKQAKLNAIFCLNGQAAEKRQEQVLKMAQEGFWLGSETFNDVDLPLMPEAEAQKEILRGRTSVSTAAAADADYFCFPYGDSSAELESFVESQGLKTVSWQIDSEDWKYQDPAELFNKVTDKLPPQKIGRVLFRGSLPQTSIVLPYLIEYLNTRSISSKPMINLQ